VSSAILWQQLLTVEILQLHVLWSSHHSLPCRTELNPQLTLALIYNISVWTTQERPHFHCCNPTVALLRICCLTVGTCLLTHCPEMVAVYSHSLAMGLWATVWYNI
jgi:hypothetical protein